MTSFNQLKQDLIDLTENNSSDFSSESPQFIDTAERRLARELINVPELYKHQNATLTIGDAFVTKPTDLITIISFQVLSSASARTALEYRDVGYINEYGPHEQAQAHQNIMQTGTMIFISLLQHQVLHLRLK